MANVSRSGYYKWLRQADKPEKDYEDYIKIKEIFDKSKGKYGWRRVKMHLPYMNHKKIQRIMRKYGLKVRIRRKNPYKKIMKKNMEHRIFPNKLEREFRQPVPHKVFCTDITYIPFCNGFVYLSAVKDISSGEVMGWKLAENLKMSLVIDTIKSIKLSSYEGIMIHSDQGFHYTNPKYIDLVREMKMKQSMSGKAKCIDNAPIESFFGHMKDELDYKTCKTFKELNLRIKEYMQYYNYERKQWNRNQMTPVEYREYLLS